MLRYLSVNGEHKSEKIIEKSRFITTSAHVEGEEQAKAFISRVSAEYADATHNCFAYICDDLGNFLRFSDAGEPQGTAGMPILEVIKNKRLYQTSVVVTRYFGGIKLGAGGLLRAYSGCAAENLDAAKKVLYEMCSESFYAVGYNSVDAAMRYFSESGADVTAVDYADEVVFTVAVKKSEEEQFNRGAIDRLNGRIRISKIREYFFPFKI